MYLLFRISASNIYIAIKILIVRPHFTPKRSGYSKCSRKEPDEWDVDGVRPWAGYHALFTCEVPLAVLHEQVPRQKQEGERQEEEEAIVKVSVGLAKVVPKIPIEFDDLRFQCERDAQRSHQNVSDGQIDQEVVTCKT